MGRAGAHNTHYLTVRLVISGWSDLPVRIERPLLHRGSSASGGIRSVTTVETDLFGRLSLPVRALRVWFTARVERGPSEAARSASTKHARYALTVFLCALPCRLEGGH